MAGGAETPKIAALPAIARLGACESARGADADRRVKPLIQFAVEGSLSGAYSQSYEHVGLTTYLTLAEIRQLMELTHEKVAEALAIKQPSVQRIEKRGNVEVMTLARHVRALGG